MKEREQLTRIIENDFAIVGLRKDGIVHVYYKPYTDITITVQEIMRVVFNEITNGKKRPFIFQAAEYCTVAKDARENAIKMESSTPLKATVIYVNSLAHKIIAEFYYKFNKPVQPYKVVSEFSEGVNWLLEVDKEIDAANRNDPS